eukprot:jgi/Chrzof1/12368/Cz06g31320.t1
MLLVAGQTGLLAPCRSCPYGTPFRTFQPRPRILTTAALPTANEPPASVTSSVTELRRLIDGTQRGLSTTDAIRSQLLATVDNLKQATAGSITTASNLSATWKLLWTTEKETLWILKNAHWFGTKAGDVFQVIDVDAQRLQNVITFPPSGAFIVDSSIAVSGPQRVQFQFKSAKLKLPNRDFNLPPYGKGWFDTVYLDDDIRIAQDIRGDTLIVGRDGPPRIFE